MRLLSLFSGAGGMDIGFEGNFWCLKRSVNEQIHPDWVRERKGDQVLLEPTGFETIFANDIRPEAKAAWVSYFSRRRSDAADVYLVESIVDLVKKAKNGERVFPENIDIVTGGFPCQDFSVAGKRMGFDSRKSHLGTASEPDAPSAENRGHLYMWMRDVISIVSPKLFVAENVKGLTSLRGAKEIIEQDFADAGNGGYLVVPARVLYAPEYGVSQSRERVFFFGFQKCSLREEALSALSKETIPPAYDPYPQPTHGIGTDCPYVTCADAFSGLTEPFESEDPAQRAYSKAKYLGDRLQGQTEVRLDSVGPTIRSEHHGNIEYRRLSPEQGGCHEEELRKGLPERRLTVRECARLQTFPDDYPFILDKTAGMGKVSASEAYRLVGNAVPCVLAYHIARNIQDKWTRYFV